MGVYDVGEGQGGMFGLVFDNTFSKQTGKTATFVLLIYPTGSPPQTMHHLPNHGSSANANASSTSLGRQNLSAASGSFDSLHSHPAPGTQHPSASGPSNGATSTYHVGNLLKRRRKKGQGYARRFFSLDYSSCTLSYYHSRNSSALRGAIPLSLAAIAADQTRREITIDSGAEVWHLRASNAKEFTDWARALERASRIARGLEAAPKPATTMQRLRADTAQALTVATKANLDDEKEWQQVETLVSRIVGTRDALRRLVKDIMSQSQQASSRPSQSPPGSAYAENGDGHLNPTDKRPFWKRKPSSSALSTTAATQAAQSSSSTALAVPAPNVTTPISANGSKQENQRSRSASREESSTEEHCQALLADLDSVVAEFTSLIARSKRRRMAEHPHSPALSRKSMESASTDEFFDAEPGETGSPIVKITRSEEDEEAEEEEDADNVSVHSSSGASSVSEEEAAGGTDQLFPPKPKSLAPLPVEPVARRKTVPPATTMPPSLIAFFRKNVGKDLSTISMPVSANEPLSLLQKVSEQLEYAQLLDQAAQQKLEKDRMLYVAAFAVSQFSSGRTRERAIRKPFNPLLGETFELVRSDAEVPGGFRLLVEKVSHRPVRLAMHADAANWSFTQAPAPGQKFWGKSAEITTEGRVRVALRLEGGADELYSWNLATMFLRNVVVGEKYVEPVGNMTVVNDSTGAKAVVEFRSKGMFGGRGEEVQVDTFDGNGTHTGDVLSGTWTSSLKVSAGSNKGKEIWRAGSLADKASQAYGFTAFAASLNEITPIEDGQLPPTDSRLRPDQRLAEAGKLDEAEEWKVKLEEAQRERRRKMEERGEVHKPRWFTKVAEGAEGDEVWRLKGGKDGYWEERARGSWGSVERIFDA